MFILMHQCCHSELPDAGDCAGESRLPARTLILAWQVWANAEFPPFQVGIAVTWQRLQ